MSASVTSELYDRHLIEHRLPGIIPRLFSGQTIPKESLLQTTKLRAFHDQLQTHISETMARAAQRLSLENTVGSLCTRNCVTSHTVLLVPSRDQAMNGMWVRLNLVISLEASTSAEGRSPRCALQKGPHRGPGRAGGHISSPGDPSYPRNLVTPGVGGAHL